MGLGAGETRARVDDERINNDLVGVGLSTIDIQKQESSAGYKLFAGYKANRHFAIEGGYFDLGDFGFTSTTAPAGSLRGNIKLQGLNLDLVGIVPLTSRFSANARIGVNYADTVDSFSGTGAVHVLNPNPNSRETNMKAGLGLQYALSPAWSVRVDLERYRINDAVGNHGDIDHLSMALVYSFGAKDPEPTQVVGSAAVARPPPPAQVYVAATTAPVLIAPARVVPPLQKVSFSTDSLFDFDSVVVTPSGKSALDTFVKELKGVTFKVITVTGHSDRIGLQDYNMLLSQRRAQAVSNYLAETGGVPADKLSSTGVGEANPVTTLVQCYAAKTSQAMIDCLAPDRRVDVEVTGTQ
jgi:OOP family OmpA-OmpF porin